MRETNIRLVEVSYVGSTYNMENKDENLLNKMKKQHKTGKIFNSNNESIKSFVKVNNPTITYNKKIVQPDIDVSDHRPTAQQIYISPIPREYKPFLIKASPLKLSYDRPKIALAKVINSIPAYYAPGDELLRYQSALKKLINAHKIYPRIARKKEIEGVVTIGFLISKNGQLKDIKLIVSSNYKILDRAAIKTITDANPFLPIPESINKTELRLVLTISFALDT